MSFNHLNMYFQDCVHIQTIATTMGYRITLDEACAIWELHSEDYAASWLCLEDDASIRNIIEYHMPIHKKVCPHCGNRLETHKDE